MQLQLSLSLDCCGFFRIEIQKNLDIETIVVKIGKRQSRDDKLATN